MSARRAPAGEETAAAGNGRGRLERVLSVGLSNLTIANKSAGAAPSCGAQKFRCATGQKVHTLNVDSPTATPTRMFTPPVDIGVHWEAGKEEETIKVLRRHIYLLEQRLGVYTGPAKRPQSIHDLSGVVWLTSYSENVAQPGNTAQRSYYIYLLDLYRAALQETDLHFGPEGAKHSSTVDTFFKTKWNAVVKANEHLTAGLAESELTNPNNADLGGILRYFVHVNDKIYNIFNENRPDLTPHLTKVLKKYTTRDDDVVDAADSLKDMVKKLDAAKTLRSLHESGVEKLREDVLLDLYEWANNLTIKIPVPQGLQSGRH